MRAAFCGAHSSVFVTSHLHLTVLHIAVPPPSQKKAMSHLVGKSADERNASAVTLDILASTKDMTAAEVAGVVTTDPSRVSGQKMLFAVRAADTAGRVQSDCA